MSLRISQVGVAPDSNTNIVRVQAQGKLMRAHYDAFVPELDRLIKKHGKVRIVFDMQDFHGWTVGAVWEDIKFDLRHLRDIERVAMVGDKAWEHAMTMFCRPFTFAKVRYFDRTESQAAEHWIAERTDSHGPLLSRTG